MTRPAKDGRTAGRRCAVCGETNIEGKRLPVYGFAVALRNLNHDGTHSHKECIAELANEPCPSDRTTMRTATPSSGTSFDAGSIKPQLYSLAELRDGTGFDRGARFILATIQVRDRIVAYDTLRTQLAEAVALLRRCAHWKEFGVDPTDTLAEEWDLDSDVVDFLARIDGAKADARFLADPGPAGSKCARCGQVGIGPCGCGFQGETRIDGKGGA